jgi:hypothetical protein
MHPGMWLIQDVIMYVFIRPLYDSFAFAIEQVLGTLLASFFTMELFMQIISDIIAATRAGSWKMFIRSIWVSVNEAFLQTDDNVADKVIGNAAGGANPIKAFKPQLQNIIYIPSFTGVAWFQTFLKYFEPGYWFGMGSTWDRITKKESPGTIVSDGHQKVDWYHELAYVGSAYALSVLKYFLNQITDNKMWAEIFTILIDLSWDLFMIYFGIKAARGVERAPSTKSKTTVKRDDKGNVVGTSTKTNKGKKTGRGKGKDSKKMIGMKISAVVGPALLDIVITIVSKYVKIPWFLKSLTDVIIRSVASLMVQVMMWTVFAPLEIAFQSIMLYVTEKCGLTDTSITSPVKLAFMESKQILFGADDSSFLVKPSGGDGLFK